MKTGLVLEGGGMRGMYTAGVIDVLMKNNVEFDGAIGVSAGAVFGSNYKSRQIGRAYRYNMKFCKDPRYASFRSWIRTGDFFGEEFCYHELPEKLDIFDQETYEKNPMDFYVVCTDVHTGKPVYHLCSKGDAEDIQWIRASASMPLVSRVVSVGGYDLLDGGIADSIPVQWFQKQGYEKSIVVLTRPKGYQKQKSKMIPLLAKFLKKYPAIVEDMKRRHLMYNAQLKTLEKLEQEGRILIIRPSRKMKISRTEKNRKKLREMYRLGRYDASRNLKAIQKFLQDRE